MKQWTKRHKTALATAMVVAIALAVPLSALAAIGINPQFKKEAYGSSSNFTSVQPTSDGVVAAGWWVNGNVANALVVRYDANGNVKMVNSNIQTSVSYARGTSDGGAICVTYSRGRGSIIFGIMKINGSGQMEWHWGGNSMSIRIESVAEVADGYIASGHDGGENYDVARPLILKLDKQGKVVSEVYVEEAKGTRIMGMTSDLLLVGDLDVVKAGADGKQASGMKQLGHICAFTETNDGYLFLVDEEDSGTSILRTNKQLDTIWKKPFSHGLTSREGDFFAPILFMGNGFAVYHSDYVSGSGDRYGIALYDMDGNLVEDDTNANWYSFGSGADSFTSYNNVASFGNKVFHAGNIDYTATIAHYTLNVPWSTDSGSGGNTGGNTGGNNGGNNGTTEPPANGWIQASNTWQYYTNGQKATGWKQIGNSWYYFDTGGFMQVSWINDGGAWYYLYPSGKMATGWLEDGGKWYYMGTSGKMAVGWQQVGGKWYYLQSSGAMKTGWMDAGGGKWYYLTSSGAMVANDWQLVGGKWYYFDANGFMLTGTQVIGGKTYRFDSSGVWLG